MDSLLPGTMLPASPGDDGNAFGALSSIFTVSGGSLSLSQITELTGLTASAVQNWVKRGWVSAPVGKRYDEYQVARILLINMLRPAMRLEDIARLMVYINGSVEDSSDDIIPEPELYSILCTLYRESVTLSSVTCDSLEILIGNKLKGYKEPVPDAAHRLYTALTVMLFSLTAAIFIRQADEILARELTPAGFI